MRKEKELSNLVASGEVQPDLILREDSGTKCIAAKS